jgi:hypothetical protein
MWRNWRSRSGWGGPVSRLLKGGARGRRP